MMPRKRDQLVDVSRAAELIGGSYNGIRNAITEKHLKVRLWFEKKGGRTAGLIARADLDKYRKRLIEFHKDNAAKTKRVAQLRKTRIV